MKPTDKDPAATDNLSGSLKKIGDALDEFLKFKHKDAWVNRDRWLKQLDQKLPEHGSGLDAVIDELCANVIPYGSPVANPGFTAFVTTSAATIAVAASTASQIAAPQRNLRHAFHLLEELSLDWIVELFRLPPGMKGLYSSGGSVANLVALGAARQYAFEQVGIDPAADGLPACRTRIYASSETHHTIKRAAGVLGLGRNSVWPVATDNLGRIQSAKLAKQIKQDLAQDIFPIAIVGNAGTTNTGAIDPLRALGEIAKQHKIWFHVDGAYGLPGILDERVAHLYDGLELIDSIIVDPHKWLGAGVGVAATFVRDRSILHRTFTQEPADYLDGSASQDNIEHSLDDFGIPYFNFGVELSAPSRGVIVWALIREIGADGMRQRMRMHNDMATHIAGRAKKHKNLELMLEPTLSICCFRYVADDVEDLNEINRRIHRQLVRENKHMPSTTLINGKLCIRPCFVGPRTPFGFADELVNAVLRIGDTVRQTR